jgi:hypothetical protein
MAMEVMSRMNLVVYDLQLGAHFARPRRAAANPVECYVGL